jgi:hypothetical protein
MCSRLASLGVGNTAFSVSVLYCRHNFCVFIYGSFPSCCTEALWDLTNKSNNCNGAPITERHYCLCLVQVIRINTSFLIDENPNSFSLLEYIKAGVGLHSVRLTIE